MLEIIGLIFLSRRNGRVAVEKGYNKGPIIVMTVVLWIGLELIGVILGLSVSDELGPILFCGIIGAIIGAILSLIITNSLQSKNTPDSAAVSSNSTAVPLKGQWFCENCGAKNAIFDDEKCFKCGELKPQQRVEPLG